MPSALTESESIFSLGTTLVPSSQQGQSIVLYETNHGTSPETSSIGTTTFQTSRPQWLRPSRCFDRSLAKVFISSLIAFFFGRALLPHIKSKYKQQTLRNKPQDVTAAFELTVLIETEFPQPSSKDKGHTKLSQRQSLPHIMGAVCAHYKLRNHTEDQCQKKACRLQRQASPATSAMPASSSAPTTHNPTSTLPQQTRAQPPARQSSPSSRSLNSMSSTLQQSSTPAPAAEQQDSIGGEEE